MIKTAWMIVALVSVLAGATEILKKTVFRSIVSNVAVVEGELVTSPREIIHLGGRRYTDSGRRTCDNQKEYQQDCIDGASQAVSLYDIDSMETVKGFRGWYNNQYRLSWEK